MRVLLDENLPIALAAELPGHAVDSVSQLGWSGLKNSELLARAQEQYQVLITMDRNLESQQNLARFELAMLVIHAPSNRMVHLQPCIPNILAALKSVRQGELRTVGA